MIATNAASQRRAVVSTAVPRAIAAALTALTSAIVCVCTFLAQGGLDLESRTTVELTLTLTGGVACAAAILLSKRSALGSGLWAIGLLFALAALTAVSVAWSVAPDASWQEAGLLLSYGALFAAAVLLARAAPGQWASVLAGVILATVVICGYALLSKSFPAQLDQVDLSARLRVPFGYWNATGLTAALGIVACLWLGTRRAGHALLSALAYPAMGLLIVTLVLSYSRGALAAALIGATIWLCIVPLRLRGALMLIVCGACASVVVAFDFSSSALSSEGVALSQRVSAGHQLGALLLALTIVLTLAGVAIGFAIGGHPPNARNRRRAGATLLGMLALVAIAGVGALASTHRGLLGTVSHSLSSLTNPNASVPANTPDRFTAVGSARARYWKQAIEVFEEHPALGAGGGGYATARKHFETGTQEVTHAHGYLVQTLADLGLTGLALTLALLAAWMLAAGQATHPFNRRWSRWRWRSVNLPYTPERIGMLSMLCIVLTFGAHSFVDWTWYVPGTACIALICAGWLAGRGPIEGQLAAGQAPSRHLPESRLTPLRVAATSIAVLIALLAAWSEWQPQRSNEASQEALGSIASDPHAALVAAQTAVRRDPLSLDALSTLAGVQEALGETAKARSTRLKAVRQQPANPLAWEQLGQHDLSSDPRSALSELRAAYYLYPNLAYRDEYVLALRAVAASGAATHASSAARSGAPRSALRTSPSSRSRASARALQAIRRARESERPRSGSPPAGRAGCAACRSAGGRRRGRNVLRRLLELAKARAR